MVEQRIKKLIPRTIPIYIGELPSAPNDVAAIMLYNSAGTAEYFSVGTICTPVIKIIVRNHSYDTAQQWIEDIKNALHRYHDDEYFLSILMQGYPLYLGKNDQKLHEFQIVFNIRIKE